MIGKFILLAFGYTHGVETVYWFQKTQGMGMGNLIARNQITTTLEPAPTSEYTQLGRQKWLSMAVAGKRPTPTSVLWESCALTPCEMPLMMAAR